MQKDEAQAIADKVRDSVDGVTAGSQVKWATLEIQVHRAATGKTEDYGVVSAYHKNPIINLWMQFRIWYRGKKRLWLQS